jgi:hypothetical protein
VAKIISPVWSVIRGSIAGTTYFPNQYGQIIGRQRTRPVNPGSTHQNRIRSAFDRAQSEYADLTVPQQEDWDTYAASVPRESGVGVITLKGKQVCIGNYGLALYLDNLGVCSFGAINNLAPTIMGMLAISNPQITAPTAGNGFRISCGNDNGHTVFLIAQRSPQTADDRYFWKGPWDSSNPGLQSVVIPDAGSDGIDFANLTLDAPYFCRFRFISETAPFRLSPVFILRKITEAAP